MDNTFSYVELFERVLSGETVTISIPDSVTADRVRQRLSVFRRRLSSGALVDKVRVPEGRDVLDYKAIAFLSRPGCLVLTKKFFLVGFRADDVKFS